MSKEEFVRRAYAVAEAKDIPAWIACFNPDGIFVDESVGVTYSGPTEVANYNHTRAPQPEITERSTLRRARGSHGGSGQRQARRGRCGRVCHLDAIASVGLGLVEGLVGAVDCARGALTGLERGEPC